MGQLKLLLLVICYKLQKENKALISLSDLGLGSKFDFSWSIKVFLFPSFPKLCCKSCISLIFIGQISFADEFHWQDSSVHARFESPFSFGYSILYRTPAMSLQHLLCSAVQEQNPVITIKKDPQLMFQIINYLRGRYKWSDDELANINNFNKILSTKPLL